MTNNWGHESASCRSSSSPGLAQGKEILQPAVSQSAVGPVWLVALLFYLLLPLGGKPLGQRHCAFWPALKANLGAQKNIFLMIYMHGRHEVMLLSLTSVVPIFILSLRWASDFGDSSELGLALASFHVSCSCMPFS